jgi:hypothetical protein
MRPIGIGIFAALLLHAADSGKLQGTVRDGSDSVVPATTISCIQEETGFRFAMTSGPDGIYRFVVPAGHYKLLARHEGFRAVARLGVAVPPNGVARIDFRLEPGSISETITVVGNPVARPFAESEGAFVVRPDELGSLPQNDRTVTGLLQFAPGMLLTPANGGEPGQWSSLGARPNTNRYTVDGVSANNAVAGGGWPSFLPGARLPAMTALGTTHDLAMFDSIQEVHVATQGFVPEAGRAPGGNIAIQTKSGTNEFHGAAFSASRLAAWGASDWFANSFPVKHGSAAFSDEGGTMGGPIRHDGTFFFIASERLDLRQIYSWTATVPSLAYRQLAPLELRALVNEFPLPNGPALSCATCFGIGELIGSSTRPAALTTASARIDHAFTPRTRVFARFAITPSWSQSGFTQINLTDYRNTIAVAAVTRETSAWTQDSRASFSRTAAASRWLPSPAQAAGGDFYSQFPSFAADFSSISVGGAGSIDAGESGRNRQDQIQLSHTAAHSAAKHRVAVGLDYLQLRPVRMGPVTNFNVAFSSPTNLVVGPAAPIWVTYSSVQTSAARLHQVSEFVQDTWKIGPRVSSTYGARMLSALAPHIAPNANLYSVTESRGSVLGYSPIPGGAPVWRGGGFAVDPAVSLAWRVSDRGSTTLRASWTSFHDGDFGVATDQLNGSPYLSLQSPQNILFGGVNLIPVNLGYGFASNLRLPVYRRWDVTVQQLWTRRDSIAVSYSGMTGSALLRRDTVFFSRGPLGQLSFASNDGASHYNGLTAAYKHTLAAGLQASAAYSWSHSIDMGSSDFLLYLIQPGSSGDRGSSDFDVRHTVTGTLSYMLPGKWTLSGVITARSGFPVDVLITETYNGSAISNDRPNIAAGVPLWIADPNVPGGTRLNANAFRAPASGIGGLGRNAIRGFAMWQQDLAAERPIRVKESLRVSFRAEAFNVFNHPQFADPLRFLSSPLFGISGSPLNLMLGSGSPASGQTPAFQGGGPRIVQLSLRLMF